jgi:hypothetical protein
MGKKKAKYHESPEALKKDPFQLGKGKGEKSVEQEKTSPP